MMTAETIKAKVAEYPAAFAALLVAFASFGILYYRSDVEAALITERDAKSKALNAMRDNERNSARLAEDVKHAERLSSKIGALALDLSSTVAVQAFLADFVQASSIKLAGPPRQQAQFVDLAAKPLATGSYAVDGDASFRDAIRYVAALESHPKRAMVVSRVQIGAAEKSPDSSGEKVTSVTQATSIAFRLWGRKGDLPVAAPAEDPAVVLLADRRARLAAAESRLAPVKPNLDSVADPFGAAVAPLVADGGTPVPVSDYAESLLNNLEFTIAPFRSELVVKIKGVGTKRVNNDFELTSGGRTGKFKIASIESDAFFVVTPSGKRIKVSQKK